MSTDDTTSTAEFVQPVQEVCCIECGRWVAGRTPDQGDGTALKPYRHKADGKDCIGRIYPVFDASQTRDRPSTAPESRAT